MCTDGTACKTCQAQMKEDSEILDCKADELCFFKAAYFGFVMMEIANKAMNEVKWPLEKQTNVLSKIKVFSAVKEA